MHSQILLLIALLSSCMDSSPFDNSSELKLVPHAPMADPEAAYPFQSQNLDELQNELQDFMISMGYDNSDAPFVYNPFVLSLAATLDRANYPKERGQWRKLKMPPVKNDPFPSLLKGAVPAYLRNLQAKPNRVFVILQGSYSTWSGGSQRRKLVAILSRLYPHAAFLNLPGFLSTAFLQAGYMAPPLGRIVALDIYQRLRGKLVELGFSSGSVPIHLIGAVSGGGTQAALLAAADRIYQNKTGKPKIFSSGMAFSPFVDLLTTFRNLDALQAEVKEQGLPQSRGLTNYESYLDYAWKSWQRGGLPSSHLLLESMIEESEVMKDFELRMKNDSTTVELRNMTRYFKGIDFSWQESSTPSKDKGYRFMHLFADWGFRQHQQAGFATIQSDVKTYTDWTDFWEKISIPFYLVTTKDDPLTQNGFFTNPNHPKFMQLPHPVAKSLATLAGNQNIRLFIPTFGAHGAYMLDHHWYTLTLQTWIDYVEHSTPKEP